MAADGEAGDRTAVKTYVPRYQKEAWKRHADRLDMSQSEFVRSMVQAGRRGFEPPGETPQSEETVDEPGGGAANTAASGDATGELGERVRTALDGRGCLSWDELLEELTDDIETRVEETLQALQAADEVRYSGRNGGYTLVDG